MTTHSIPEAVTVAVTSATATTGALRLRDIQWGRLLIPAGVANTTLTFYESDTEAGTYLLCSDVGTAGVVTFSSTVSTGLSIVLPTGLAGSRWIKMVSNVGSVNVKVVLKTQ